MFTPTQGATPVPAVPVLQDRDTAWNDTAVFATCVFAAWAQIGPSRLVGRYIESLSTVTFTGTIRR